MEPKVKISSKVDRFTMSYNDDITQVNIEVDTKRKASAKRAYSFSRSTGGFSMLSVGWMIANGFYIAAIATWIIGMIITAIIEIAGDREIEEIVKITEQERKI